MTPLTPTEDIRAARHMLAAKFDNDLDRIVADLRRQQAESAAEFVTLPGSNVQHNSNQPMHPSDSSGLADNRGPAPTKR